MGHNTGDTLGDTDYIPYMCEDDGDQVETIREDRKEKQVAWKERE